MWAEAALAVVRSSGLENDPVFLAVFVILSYRRLFSATQSITIGSVLLTVLVAAACSRLAPLLRPLVLPQPPQPPPQQDAPPVEPPTAPPVAPDAEAVQALMSLWTTRLFGD